MKMLIYILIAVGVLVSARPQSDKYQERPKPYDYQHKVDHPPTNTYFGQNESGDPAGRVHGSYYILLPDGRLLTVEYYVDGQSGFVLRLTYQHSGRPEQG